ncbi:MAG: PqqD family protein [Myxococcales bacterium]|nr:PqqD family protein [Myxococcales bacterium]
MARPPANLLERVPRPRVEHFIQPETGRVTLKVPRFENRLLRRLFGWLNRSPTVDFRLDEIGSFVWLRMDGARTVGRISEETRAHFGQRVEPAYERVGLFCRNLLRDGLIRLDGSEPAR